MSDPFDAFVQNLADQEILSQANLISPQYILSLVQASHESSLLLVKQRFCVTFPKVLARLKESGWAQAVLHAVALSSDLISLKDDEYEMEWKLFKYGIGLFDGHDNCPLVKYMIKPKLREIMPKRKGHQEPTSSEAEGCSKQKATKQKTPNLDDLAEQVFEILAAATALPMASVAEFLRQERIQECQDISASIPARFPDSWVQATHALGTLSVEAADERQHCLQSASEGDVVALLKQNEQLFATMKEMRQMIAEQKQICDTLMKGMMSLHLGQKNNGVIDSELGEQQKELSSVAKKEGSERCESERTCEGASKDLSEKSGGIGDWKESTVFTPDSSTPTLSSDEGEGEGEGEGELE